MLTILVLATCFTAAAYAKAPSIQLRTSQEIVATWTCEDKIPQDRTPARSPWKHHSTSYRAAELNLWQGRLADCRKTLADRAREWNWAAWLPRNWYLVGSCETGYGGPPNWFHGNSSYVSAFGIQRGSAGGQYDNDAAKVGMPPWNDAHPPSPWAQYQTALSHYRSFGDGWGCPGP
jgi:hypothetical protein